MRFKRTRRPLGRRPRELQSQSRLSITRGRELLARRTEGRVASTKEMNITRLELISALFANPFVAVGVTAPSATKTASAKTIAFPPGIYRIAPGGHIRIVDTSDIYIKACVFEDCACKTG